MLVCYNRLFPFGSFWAINLLGIVFARSDKGRLGDEEMNHEYIHTLQQREMLFVVFYIWYVAEWLFHFCRYRNLKKAYYHISFEREAYRNQRYLTYRLHRRHFAWRRFLTVR